MVKRGINYPVYSEDMNNKNNFKKEKKVSPAGIVITCIVIVFVVSLFITLLSSNFKKTGSNTAIIKINGELFTGSGNTGVTGTYSDEIISFVNDAIKNKNVKAILFEIDSPGGSAVASKEIADAVKLARQNGILTVAYIRETGASGAYWVASSCDYIVASPMSIVGSIGVIGSYLEYSGLLERFNVTYERLVGGQYKDIGSPYKELTPAEREILQNIINKIYDNFVNEVSVNRNISLSQTYNLANGLFYLGEDAKQLGLVDSVGTKEDAFAYIENKENMTVKTYSYSSSNSLLGLYGMQSRIAFWIGKGIGSSLVEKGFSVDNQLNIKAQ
ncbi:MAG: signal peptide peptidase SppA [Candidatus Pacearchaeota archaeon]|nr:signal peptide peptidase SppA [Candidatus Pacearchaeota archaeon]